MTPPPLEKRSPKSHLDTPTRARFFEAIDRRGERTKKDIYCEFNIPKATAFRLLQQRSRYGKLADRRSKLREYKKEHGGIGSGRPRKVSDETLQRMLKAPQSIRTRKLEHQIAHAGIDASRETVRRALTTRVDAAMRRAASHSSITVDQAD